MIQTIGNEISDEVDQGGNHHGEQGAGGEGGYEKGESRDDGGLEEDQKDGPCRLQVTPWLRSSTFAPSKSS